MKHSIRRGLALRESKGFTLIELLVVIAIIGILAAIILASLATARSKGNDAKIQSQLVSMQQAAEIYYSSNSDSYGTGTSGMCSVTSSDNSGLYTLEKGASWPSGTAPTCNSSGTAYAIFTPLTAVTNMDWCVDSTGVSRQEAAPATGATAC